MAKKKITGWSLSVVRLSLYIYWCFIFLAYLGLFARCRLTEEFDKSEVDDAIRQVLIIMVPVLAAFLGFWFDDMRHVDKDDDERVSGTVVFAAFSGTTLGHVIVGGYLALAIASLNFPDKEQQSFQGVVKEGFNYLAICSSLITLPVGYALKREVKLGKPGVDDSPG